MHFGLLNNNHNISNIRINVLQGVIFFLIITIIIRLFYLQIIQHDYYLAAGLQQRGVIADIAPERGGIFALVSEKNNDELYPLAINEVYYEVNVNPSKITRPQNIADILVDVLECEEDKVLTKVKKTNRQYELIAQDVPRAKVEQLKIALEELKLDINKDKPATEQLATIEEIGVNFVKHILRLYPDKDVGAHILGFLGYGADGYSRVGKYGLEGYWQEDLVGYKGKIVGEKNTAGLISTMTSEGEQDGPDIVLTIDRTVQYMACKALEKAVAQYEADSGTVIIMETATGAIRAMCNYPSFDPNEYSQVESSDVYNNNAVYQAYEPGSVMKAITMAIAIDQGKVSPDTLYNDTGEVKFSSGQIIKNSDLKAHGLTDMKDVLTLSLNTGIVFATSDINNKIFQDYMERFGFGQETGISLSQDNTGDISSLAKTGDIFKATASYGQGITVTPLQMLNAFNTIANRGNLVQPYLVKQIKYINGSTQNFEPKLLRQVISKGTASQLSAMLINVVDNGHAKKAAVPGYYVAGKTGTAQVPNLETGRYDDSKTIHSFIGFAPNDNPKFTMITKLDHPAVGAYAESTAVPLFGEIAKFLLEYYQITPNR